MTPGLLNISIKRGVTFGPLRLTCFDVDDEFVPLTGCTVHAEVRKKAGAIDLVLDLTPEITDYGAGEITIEFTDEETFAMRAGEYVWDLIIEEDGERLGPFLSGTFSVTDIATKP